MPAIEIRRAPHVVPDGVLAFVPVRAPAEHREDAAHAAHDDLVASELQLALAMSPARRLPFVAGRQALRAALRALDPRLADTPLLRTARGAPDVPTGAIGSVSHKQTRAVALAAPAQQMEFVRFVGVDLESRPVADAPVRDRRLASRILTAREFDAISPLDDAAHREATLLYFALKEAVYKTIDPFVERYVRFTEVELSLSVDALHGGETSGIALVTLRLAECDELALHVDAAWTLEPDWIVATAISASPRAARFHRRDSASRASR
ncbi:MAG TPA: 4'-phosphopantetheinyl transferase superfamily protein [Gemmatimonas sp.]|nr:4'-phosphopantetheinyl transferase superfamily protein [Gemmatimonas sp.]